MPARGTKIVWYMVYRVYNLDPREEPVTFVPDIELVTLDRHTRHPDEILPSVEEAIRKREDPTGRYKIKNSVTITADQIPVSKKDAYPRAITGVAIWTGVDDPIPGAKEPIPKTNKFSIFVAGLSNGYTEEQADRPARGEDHQAEDAAARLRAARGRRPGRAVGHPLDGQRDLDVPGLDRTAEAGRPPRRRRRRPRRKTKRRRHKPRGWSRSRQSR